MTTTTVPTDNFTMFDQPLPANYRTEGGVTERVSMIGSDVSRTVYHCNVVLIERPDGTRCVASEASLSS